jgi:hypothetical protein
MHRLVRREVVRQVLPWDPVRFTYKIAFTISRRLCCVGDVPNSTRLARQVESIGSISAQRASDRSVRYGRREVVIHLALPDLGPELRDVTRLPG